ncbi:hypothetical protein ACFX13_019678 [Malus domestica]
MMSVASPRKSITEKVFKRRHHRHNQHKACENDESDDDYYKDEETVELVQIGAERTKNILILMNDTDGGHSASSKAIRDAFRMEFGDEYRIFVKDVWKEYTSWPLNNMERSTSSLKARIRSLTRDVVKEIQRSGTEYGCGKPIGSDCRSYLMREVSGRLSNEVEAVRSYSSGRPIAPRL